MTIEKSSRRFVMKFQTKLVITYVTLSVLIACVMGSIYFSANMSRLREQEYQNLRVTAKQVEQQYDELIESMKDVSHYLLSDPDMLNAIINISYMKDGVDNKNYISQSQKTIRVKMSTDYLTEKFYRVVYCNNNCEAIANNNWLDRQIQPGLDFSKMPWYTKAKNNTGTFTILGIYKDPWGKKTNPEVFSVIKEIQGENLGYIEVQKDISDVKKILNPANERISMCMINSEKSIFYETGKNPNEELSKNYYENGQDKKVLCDKTGKKYLAASTYYKETGNTILVTENSDMFMKEAGYIYLMTFLLTGGVMSLSIGYVMIASKRLTKPMHQLQKVIENTKLETLDQPLNIPKSNDEFQKMIQIYQEMKEGLNHAIVREKRLSILQLQAQFDMLQAQVNPHFLYNVLNVISNRGILNDDEVICDICDDLAGMLRYATDTKEKYATIQSESHFLELYFSLLKYRYEHKLEYKIDIVKAIDSEILPKLVLQQLVENSIAHGFKNSSKIMKICVLGWVQEDNWYIKISDNGEGFEQTILAQLEYQMESIRRGLSTNREHMEMKIGGMGIINTYARLYLLNADKLTFKIGNTEEGGAEIIVGAPIKNEKL